MILNRVWRFCHSSVKIANIDISRYLACEKGWQDDCKQVAESLVKYGLLIIKDPRVNAQKNDQFLDMLERYFEKRSQQYHSGNKTIDFSPESNFQLGIMHQYQQKFQSYQEQKSRLKPPNQSLTPIQASRDPKWRFHWKVDLQDNVIPSDFPEWSSTMNGWGQNMKNGCLAVAEMAAVGLGIQKDYLSNTIRNGAFMLSPTAVDLQRSKEGDVIAAFHRDFDLLTIHGKARFSGLFAWLNTGQKFVVRVPSGHLLLQAGKQLEWLTGGHIKAGFHEVVYTEEVQTAKKLAIENGKSPWRISSTMFCQVQDTYILEPHPKFRSEQSLKSYYAIRADSYLNSELNYLTNKT